MTTAFESETYYTPTEWEILIKDAQELFSGHLVLLGEMYLKERTAIADASKRHNVPLNTAGYTDPEHGCSDCGRPMDFIELDMLAISGLPPDTCHKCQCGGVCPECGGTGELQGKRLLSRDWLDAPEYDVMDCEACNGTGDYDVYMVRNE